MIAVLQFDAVNLPLFHQLLDQRRLPASARLHERGHWSPLESAMPYFEGTTHPTIYSGVRPERHGQYFPFMWSASEQRVRPARAFPSPEPVWDRIGRADRRALVIDPYEARRATSVAGVALSGWQFRHKVTLHPWSSPAGVDRALQRRFGRGPLVEEVYGRPSRSYLSRMRHRLLAASRRVGDVASYVLSREGFDLVWITMLAGHIAGHWFLDPSRLPLDGFPVQERSLLESTVAECYLGIEDALTRVLAALPADADILLVSPTGMGLNASRTHLLPGMLQALLTGGPDAPTRSARSGGALWKLRAAIPTDVRAWVARVLPDALTLELTARLEMRNMHWARTRAFMPPSGDCGYVRLNVRGRERDGIVDPRVADALLVEIAQGLMTFHDPDGRPAIDTVQRAATVLATASPLPHFPDLVVRWNPEVPPRLSGVHSARYGDVESVGWGSGRTGEHTDDGWILVVPGRSRLAPPRGRPHLVDVAATVCEVLGVNRDGLDGTPLLAAAERE
jgi:predicted AlkP superfamily phosphohydrolase/phosphomutase